MKHRIYSVQLKSPCVYLVRANGEFYFYSSYEKFLSLISYDLIWSMGISYNSFTVMRGEGFLEREYTTTPEWIARFDNRSGTVIHPDKIRHDLKIYKRAHRKPTFWDMRNERVFEFRADSVPRIGKSRHCHYWRHPRTTQERRWSLAWKEDGVMGRASRNFHNLPTTWDDIYRASYENKNWKKFRKHQWRDRHRANDIGIG